MAKTIRVPRQNSELLTRLICHLELLIEYSDKTFYEYQYEKYMGEVAGKLRLLLIEAKHNQPLLIGLMHEFGYERVLKVQTGQEFTLRTYIYYLAVFERGRYTFTNENLIRALAEQTGAGHEDWKIDEGLYKFINGQGARSGDSPYMHRVMRNIINTVLTEAALFLYYLHQEDILNKLGVKYTLRQILNIATHYGHGLDWNLKSRREKEIEWKARPTKDLLQPYDILQLKGEGHLFSLNIPGIISKEEFEKDGPKEDFWMLNNKRYIYLKEEKRKKKKN